MISGKCIDVVQTGLEGAHRLEGELRLHPAPVNTGAEWFNLAVRQWNGDGIVFLRHANAASALGLQHVIDGWLRTDEGDVALAPLTKAPRLKDLEGLPPQVVMLTPGLPDGAAFVFRRAALNRALPFRPVDDPVWDLAIRLGTGSARLQVLPPPPNAEPRPLSEFPPLVPQTPGGWLLDHVRAIRLDNFGEVVSPPDAVALRAGLFLWHDALDDSHALSQRIEGQGRRRAGDYWHAIMHRREPDYGNAKYWFRQVGRHAIFGELAERADGVLRDSSLAVQKAWRTRLGLPGGWDAFAFVDLCEQAAGDPSGALDHAARRIQWEEMHLLLRHTCRDAFGG